MKAAEENAKAESLAKIDAEADRRVAELIEREAREAVDLFPTLAIAEFDLSRFTSNHLLFGHDPEPGIVAGRSCLVVIRSLNMFASLMERLLSDG